MNTNTLTAVENCSLYRGAGAAEKAFILANLSIIEKGIADATAQGYHNYAAAVSMDWDLLRIVKQIVVGAEDAAKAAAFTVANQKKFGTITPAVMDAFQPGAILNDTWGCEQTNQEFYCIVARSGDSVTVLPMTAETTAAGDMVTKESPLVINWGAKPVRKKIQVFSGKESGFSFRSYSGGGWCDLWDGRAKSATHYA